MSVISTKELEGSVKTKLDELSISAHVRGEVPPNTSMPYNAFKLLTNSDNINHNNYEDTIYTLEVDTLYNQEDLDSTDCENMADSVYNLLNRYYYEGETKNFFYDIIFTNRLNNLPTDNEFIIRRQNIFDLKIRKKEV
jgi:hypothetical protein